MAGGYEFNGGFFTMTLKPPRKPIKMEAPDYKHLFLHEGENETQFNSFLEVINDLSEAFKFLPKYDQMRYEFGNPLSLLSKDDVAVKEYIDSLVEFEADPAKKAEIVAAGDILLDPGKSLAERQIALGEIQAYIDSPTFGDYSKQEDPYRDGVDWGYGSGVAFSNLEFSPVAFGGKSFYQIAMGGASLSKEDAFSLMKTMIEAKDKVFGALEDIFGAGAFGDPSSPTYDTEVIDHISGWLAEYSEVDPHNLAALKMFFGMESDFINTLDAYRNCSTYWGDSFTEIAPGDSHYELSGFGSNLLSKVQEYIDSLDPSSPEYSDAVMMRDDWFYCDTARWDKVGEDWTAELALKDGSWVKYFYDEMKTFAAQDVIRVIICNMLNRSESNEYTQETKKYESEKEALMMDEVQMQRLAAKKAAESKAAFRKFMARRASMSKALNKVSRKRTTRVKRAVAPKVARPKPKVAPVTPAVQKKAAPKVTRPTTYHGHLAEARAEQRRKTAQEQAQIKGHKHPPKKI